MEIIKKDGRIQEFDEGKIVTSLLNASRDIEKAELNESDIKVICSDVVAILEEIRKDGSYSSSYEIIGVIMNVLLKDEFVEVLRAYLEH